MFDTHLTLIGQLASDVRFAVSSRPQGEEDLSVAKFRMATTNRKYDKTKATWVDGDTMFATIVCFRRLAEHVSSSLKRGDPVMVYGKMRTRQWQGDNRSGTELEVIAIAAGHNLQLGTAMFSKSLFRTLPDGVETGGVSSTESGTELAGSGSASGPVGSGSVGSAGGSGSGGSAGGLGSGGSGSGGPAGGSVHPTGDDLFSRAADAQAADTEAATPMAAVTPLPGVSDIRSVGAVDAPSVQPTRSREEGTSPHPTSSTPSTPADEQAA